MAKIVDIADLNVDSIDNKYRHKEIEYIDISSVGSGVLLETKLYNITKAPSRAKRLVAKGDTILSTVRPNRRSFLYMKNPKDNWVVSTGFAVLRPKQGVDSRFLYYTVTHQRFTDYLTLSAKGAAYPAVDTEIINRAECLLPSLPTQQKIGAILSFYDDLIENNNRRIKILEEIAQMIYNEWFVKFQFPGHAKVKMVDSELGKMPEGWEVRKIFDITTVRYGKNLPSKILKKNGKHLVYGAAKIIGRNDDYNCETPTVITGCRGSCGQIKMTKPKSFVTNNSFIFDFAEKEKLFFYHSLINNGLQNYLGGTAQPQITLESISALKLVVPKQELIAEFNKIVSPVFEQINLLDDKNNNLRNTRDLLLPKLISGEIDVEGMDIDVGDVD